MSEYAACSDRKYKKTKHLPAYHVFMESIFMKQQIISSPYNNMCNKLHVFSSSGTTDFFLSRLVDAVPCVGDYFFHQRQEIIYI